MKSKTQMSSNDHFEKPDFEGGCGLIALAVLLTIAVVVISSLLVKFM